MKINSSSKGKKIILVALVTVLSGSVFGVLSATANDPYNQTEPLYISDIDYINNINKPQYEKNSNGQTYGSASLAANLNEQPDLIDALGVDGTRGYVYKKDLNDEVPKTVQEALQQQAMALKSSGNRQIPLYDKDGKTVIGVFEISGFAVEDVEEILKDMNN